MENTQNNTGSKKTVLITIITGVAVLGVLVWWISMKSPGSYQSSRTSPTPVVDPNADINKDLNGINVQTPDFNSIDQGIKGL